MLNFINYIKILIYLYLIYNNFFRDVGDNFSNLVDRDMKTQLKKNMESN